MEVNMRYTLSIFFLVLVFIGCEDKKEGKEESPSLVGVWDISFMGDYENADCTGEIDSLGWNLLQAFGFESTMTLKKDGTYSISTIVWGFQQTETGTWEETADNSICFDGDDCQLVSLASDGNTFTTIVESDDHCEDYDGNITAQTDSSSCETAGNEWVEAACMLTEYTRQ